MCTLVRVTEIGTLSARQLETLLLASDDQEVCDAAAEELAARDYGTLYPAPCVTPFELPPAAAELLGVET